MKRPYEAPALAEIGTVQEMTMQFKAVGFADGIILQGPDGNVPIGSV